MRIVEFIKTLAQKPGLFQIENVEDVALIIFGIIYGLSEAEAKDITDLMQKFRSFCNEHWNIEGDNDWPRLIRFHSSGDKHSIELFGFLWDKFMTSKW